MLVIWCRPQVRRRRHVVGHPHTSCLSPTGGEEIHRTMHARLKAQTIAAADSCQDSSCWDGCPEGAGVHVLQTVSLRSVPLNRRLMTSAVVTAFWQAMAGGCGMPQPRLCLHATHDDNATTTALAITEAVGAICAAPTTKPWSARCRSPE